MGEYLISLENRLQEVNEGKRETIQGMTFWNSLGGDRITILKFDKQTKNFSYRRTFSRDDEAVSSDVSTLGNLGTYFDITTVKKEDLEPRRVHSVSGVASACVDVGD